MHATHLQIQTKAEIEPCMCEWLLGLSVADLNLLWGPGTAKPLLHHYLGRCGFSVPCTLWRRYVGLCIAVCLSSRVAQQRERR